MDKATKILLIAFVVLGVILAFVGGKFVFNLVKSWTVTSLPGAPVDLTNNTTSTGGETTAGVPLQSNNAPAGAAWDGKSRINILLLGLDYSTRRQAEDQGSPLSDTMMLVTVDPMTKTIGVMGILRDLWVNIPGFEYNKINSAYKLGEDYQLPEGGAGLAMETVEGLLGVPIDFYAKVDFNAFTRIIDELDGIIITTDQPMLLDWYGHGDKFWLEPGTYSMPGSFVLAYARTRDAAYGDGDYARSQRQMQVIKAIFDRVLDLNRLPNLIAKAPAIYAEISSGVQTNMSFDQAIQLAYLVSQIPRENMKTYTITTNEAVGEVTPDGIYILRVIPDQLRILRDQVFTASGVAAAPIVMQESGVQNAGDPLTLAVTEGARIAILNGTNTGGLAETTASYLTGQGLNVVMTGNTDNADNTTIIYHSNTPYAIKYLSALMQVSNARIYNQNDPNSTSDVTVILGNDWATSNPMQ